ncbi:MAG: RagB/SusD family nutrient uptake outer membrane protein [Prevotellaceae bacterium]|jgi:hypothetical protein|nr:RagB/SusD family nutrient uptake outer membrane protein [Prevotellaceae bacterium]
MKIVNKLKVKLQTCAIAACLVAFTACNEYLDIAPDDGLPTLEMAFALRSTAIRYLNTCYSFMPREGHPDTDDGMMTGDELWGIYDRRESNNFWNGSLFNIARGFQSANTPAGNDWDAIYQGIRICNILMEEVGTVPDLPEWERLQWIAEAKFLKARYHFHLVRKWGPIPIVRENLPIYASVDEVRVSRNPVDECFDYILQLLDEAIPDLPLVERSRDEWGRITRPIAAAVKARVAVFAASPLFNNNTQQVTLVNKDGTPLFASKTAEETKARWDSAVVACRKAIDICNQASKKLFTHQSRWSLNDTLLLQLDIRNVLTEKWNEEIIWTNTQTPLGANNILQQCTMPNFEVEDYPDVSTVFGNIQPPLKIAEMFYTSHGIPIENDKTWNAVDPYALRIGGNAERWYIARGYTTVELNFDREPRFYAWLGFDGGIWYGQRTSITSDPDPDELISIRCRAGGIHRKMGYDWGPVTGYYPKKLVHYETAITGTGANGPRPVSYPWPIFRLADLYLLYAEAINESEGPNGAHSSEMFQYIDMVRSRAGLPAVQEAWDSEYSNEPGKYNEQAGMREIIHRERLIELAFEGQRFWDLRRWKEADAEYAKGIRGFKVTGSRPEDYYQQLLLADQQFGIKDYFWPIAIATIEQNPNLVQNIGW